MHRFIVAWLGGLLACLLLAPGAVSASVFEFESTLTLHGTSAGVPEIASGTGVAEVGSTFGQLSHLRMLGGHVAGGAVVPITDPLVSNGGLVQIEITAELPLSASTLVGFDPFGGPFGSAAVTRGTLPLRGERLNCLIQLACTPGLRQTLPFHTSQSGAGYGVGGVLTVGGTATIRISLHGAPFTLGPVTFENATQSGATATQVVAGFVHGPLSNSFSGANTVGGLGGGLQLVSPVRTRTIGSGGPGVGMHYVRLNVDFIPEPSLVLGLCAALALLWHLAPTRTRR